MGASLNSGRWNSQGTFMVYAATSRPMAVLEMLVHISNRRVTPDVRLFAVEIPDELIAELKPLPHNWNVFPYEASAVAAGDRWVRANSSAALLVPSAVLSKEHNILLNPAHPDFRRVKAHKPESNFLDPRLFR
jgi:RES domain-containing protein